MVWDSCLRFRFYIQVWNKIWDSGLGFKFLIQFCHLGLGFRFKSQVWDSGFGFKLIIHVEIQVWESGFRFWFGTKVWD